MASEQHKIAFGAGRKGWARAARSRALAFASVLVLACSGGGPGSQGDGSSTGTGPCSVGTQEECNACIFAANAVCNQSTCSREDTALENCAVLYAPVCQADTGRPVDCCAAEEATLAACYETCPQVQACV